MLVHLFIFKYNNSQKSIRFPKFPTWSSKEHTNPPTESLLKIYKSLIIDSKNGLL